MWKRKELKSKAKSSLKTNYWRSVLVAVIMSILISGGSAGIRSGALSGGISGAAVGSGMLPNSVGTVYDQNYDANTGAVDKTVNTEAVDTTTDTEAADAPVDTGADAEATDAAVDTEAVDTTAGTDAGNAEINDTIADLADEYGYDADMIADLADEYGYDAKTDINASVEDILKLAGVNEEQLRALNDMDEDTLLVIIMLVLAAFAGILLLVAVISFVLNLLVFNPFKVGCYAFFMENTRTDNTNISALERGFTPKFGRNVGSMLLKNIYICLWTMLFVIPGIIKAYSYRLVPYILADDPEISANEAITRSRYMMNGNKWRAFVLDLSFIGWHILSAMTFGLVGLFYVNPYKYGTDAALYNALKEEKLTIHQEASAL